MPDRALGLVIGAFALAAMVVRPLAGWASDRFGRKPWLLAGAAIFVAAPLGYAASATAMGLLAVRLAHGAGMGLFPTAASAAAADLAPPHRRGQVMGFFGVAANLAMAAGPLAGLAIAERFGFPALFGVSAVGAAAALALSATLPETLARPTAIPLRPDAALSRAALHPSTVVLGLMLTYGMLVAFLPVYAAAHRLNSGLFFLAFALAGAVFRGPVGHLSDRVGRRPVAVAGLALVAAALGALAIVKGTAALVGAGALYGAGFGAAQSALMAWCIDRVEPHDRGRAMGTYFTALELGIAVGATSAGPLVASVGFAPTFAGAAAVAIGASVVALARPRAT